LLEALQVYVAYDEYVNGPEGDPETNRLQKAKAAIASALGHKSDEQRCTFPDCSHKDVTECGK